MMPFCATFLGHIGGLAAAGQTIAIIVSLLPGRKFDV